MHSELLLRSNGRLSHRRLAADSRWGAEQPAASPSQLDGQGTRLQSKLAGSFVRSALGAAMHQVSLLAQRGVVRSKHDVASSAAGDLELCDVWGGTFKIQLFELFASSGEKA